jgi:hypothetical protein
MRGIYCNEYSALCSTFVLAHQLLADVQIPFADCITKNLFESLGSTEWK